MKKIIRIGAASFLNTRPLIYGLERGLGADRIELSYGAPAQLADRMAAGELEIALLPIIELARMPELEIVPGLAIVTRGKSESVKLICKRPLAEIGSVALDPESRSSNMLTRILFAEHWGGSPRFADGPPGLEDALSEFDAAIRIGDKALFEPAPSGSIVHDLAEVWTQWTGLPFVYAAWVVRPGLLDREIYRILHRSHREGRQQIDAIAGDHGWQGERFPELARDYLRNKIHFRCGTTELRALRLFFEKAAALGLIDGVPPLKMALQSQSACHQLAGRDTTVRHSEV